MLSRVEWLKECEKHLICCSIEDCDLECDSCKFDGLDSIELLESARDIFNRQIFIENNGTDDGK